MYDYSIYVLYIYIVIYIYREIDILHINKNTLKGSGWVGRLEPGKTICRLKRGWSTSLFVGERGILKLAVESLRMRHLLTPIDGNIGKTKASPLRAWMRSRSMMLAMLVMPVSIKARSSSLAVVQKKMRAKRIKL